HITCLNSFPTRRSSDLGLLNCFADEGYEKIDLNVTGPEGGTVPAVYYMKEDTAILETAEACGLHLLAGSAPGRRTSFGVGELILDRKSTRLNSSHVSIS